MEARPTVPLKGMRALLCWRNTNLTDATTGCATTSTSSTSLPGSALRNQCVRPVTPISETSLLARTSHNPPAPSRVFRAADASMALRQRRRAIVTTIRRAGCARRRNFRTMRGPAPRQSPLATGRCVFGSPRSHCSRDGRPCTSTRPPRSCGAASTSLRGFSSTATPRANHYPPQPLSCTLETTTPATDWICHSPPSARCPSARRSASHGTGWRAGIS